MKTNKLYLFAVLLFTHLIGLSQSTPFGEVKPIPMPPGYAYGNQIMLTAFKTNLLVADALGNIWIYKSETFDQVRKTPVTGRVAYKGLLKETPFFVSTGGDIIYLNSENKWITVNIQESVYSVSCSENSLVIIGLKSDRSFNIIETKDFIFFKRYQNNFVDSGLFGFDTLNAFHINNILHLKYKTKDKMIFLKTTDFLSFEEINTPIIEFNFGCMDNGRVFFTSNGILFTADPELKKPLSLGVSVDANSFVKISNMLFAVSPNKQNLLYSNDGLNWASFSINLDRGIIKPLAALNKNLVMTGNDYVLQLGPFFSSEQLQVQSELVHSIKITGNIGQQVEILSSDELNGEYKPLTYFTLPSTEYIYNDNRTNKAKQYYKVR